VNPVPFTVEATCGGARAGVLRLARGAVRTPIYMPVGTQGAVRAISPLHLEQTGAQIILANTYHLSQRPGSPIVGKHGGLHKMMAVNLPILTDSGGFQVFSLKKVQVEEEGVTFAYELDGKRTFLSPERSMEIQQQLGADIAMAFDECPPHDADRPYVERSMARTTQRSSRQLRVASKLHAPRSKLTQCKGTVQVYSGSCSRTWSAQTETPASVGSGSPASSSATAARAFGSSRASASAPTMRCPLWPQASASVACSAHSSAGTSRRFRRIGQWHRREGGASISPAHDEGTRRRETN